MLITFLDLNPGNDGDSKKSVKVYFDGPSDSRHILQTISQGLAKRDGLEMQVNILNITVLNAFSSLF